MWSHPTTGSALSQDFCAFSCGMPHVHGSAPSDSITAEMSIKIPIHVQNEGAK